MVSMTLAIAVVVFLLFTIGTAIAVRKLFGNSGGGEATGRRRQSKGARSGRDDD